MIQRPKWIYDVAADEPAIDVARRVIAQRLESIGVYLPHAARQDRDPVEDVHQLRVACRRAEASLRVFRDLIGPRRRRRLQSEISRVRRAASEARDLDVLQLQLRQDYGQAPAVFESEDVAAAVCARRTKAQRPIRKAFRRWRRNDTLKNALKGLKKKFWRRKAHERSFDEIGVAALNRGVTDFFDKGDQLVDLNSLHEMRKSGKRLRYSIELLSGIFPTVLRTELYESFVDVQDRLGIVNDHAVAARLADQWAAKCDGPAEDRFREMSRCRLEQLALRYTEFRRWWTLERAAELKGRFLEVLGKDLD